MQKILLLSFSLTLLFLSCNTKVPTTVTTKKIKNDKEKVIFKDKIAYSKENSKPYTNTQVKYHNDENPKIESLKKDGKDVLFYKSGKKKQYISTPK